MYYNVGIKNLIKKQFFFDISDYKKLDKTIKFIKPNYIFHLAAQSLFINLIKKL